MKKKVCFIFSFLIILMILLSACNLENADEQDNIKTGGSLSDTTQYSYMIDNSCETDKGTYSLYQRYTRDGEVLVRANGRVDSQFVLLKFFDYETLNEVVLCNQPNCNHDNNLCNAFFELDRIGLEGKYAIFSLGNKIYVLVNDKIYEINEDGTGRNCVFEIPKEYYSSGYSSAYAYILGDKLYFEVANINDNAKTNMAGDLLAGESPFLVNLFEVSLENWKCERIYSYEDDGCVEWLGIANNKSFYIQQEEMKDLTEYNQQAYDAMFNDRDTKLFVKDLDTGEEEVIISGNSLQCDRVVFKDSNIYYQNRELGQIIELNTKTYTKTILIEDIFEYVVFFNNDTIDDKLFYYIDYQNADAYNVDIPINTHHYIDLKTKETHAIDYQIQNEDNTLGFMREITMITPEYFIIPKSCLPPTYEYTYAKVNREDFLNNDFSIESIEWVYGK